MGLKAEADKLQNLSPKTGNPDAVLRVLDSLLADPAQKRLTGSQAIVILDALASSDDRSLVIQFPVILSICARHGVSLDSHMLFSKYWESSPKKQSLEKLLLISAELFELEGMEGPRNLKKIASSLKAKYETLISAEMLSLSSGLTIAIRDIQNVLRQHAARTEQTLSAAEQYRADPHPNRANLNHNAGLQTHLNRLFSPKQKDLVFKKLNCEPFTKTEREYYSRVVKKKLEAIADADLNYIANRLTKKVS
ncbi:MAG: hypothetical protein P8X68_10630 [Desulfobacterales bacterium]|jgi:hypothetical protein